MKYGRNELNQTHSTIEENLGMDVGGSTPFNSTKKKPGPMYQLSLDASLLENESEFGTKCEKQTTKVNRQLTFDSSEETKSEVKKLDVKASTGDALKSGVNNSFSFSEINVDCLGVSFVNQSKSVQNLNGKTRKIVDENDLSSQFNHYRCISPNDGTNRTGSSRFLKRQFSIDKEEVSEGKNARLCKQHSAGAANDLGRIDEIPILSSPKFKQNSNYMHRTVPSTASTESLN